MEFSTECAQFRSPDAGAHANEVSGTEQLVASLEQRTSPFISSFNRKDEKYIPIKDRVSQRIPSARQCVGKIQANLEEKGHTSTTFGKNR